MGVTEGLILGSVLFSGPDLAEVHFQEDYIIIFQWHYRQQQAIDATRSKRLQGKRLCSLHRPLFPRFLVLHAKNRKKKSNRFKACLYHILVFHLFYIMCPCVGTEQDSLVDGILYVNWTFSYRQKGTIKKYFYNQF